MRIDGIIIVIVIIIAEVLQCIWVLIEKGRKHVDDAVGVQIRGRWGSLLIPLDDAVHFLFLWSTIGDRGILSGRGPYLRIIF